jgi:3-oxoacyl-ACP reductase-like protein
MIDAPATSHENAAVSSSSAAAAPSKTAPPAEAAANTASLDLDSLEQRLRETKAIGVFTKLSLKNQVDDLLNDFKTFYGGKSKLVLTDLRQRYDLLVMKILTLLQDSDTRLAADIRSSREAIWDILQDREKFSKIS